ncbi:MAG TPA: superoxide dismutase [Streptomyces sp.]
MFFSESRTPGRAGRRGIALLAACAALALTAGTADAAGPVTPLFTLPAGNVAPESLTADPATGDIYVSSYTNGEVDRRAAGSGQARVFIPAGADGRANATGVKVDSAGRLWVLGGPTGIVDVYDVKTGARIAAFTSGSTDGLLNDVAFGPDGSAYITDSYLPVVYRVAPADLAGAANGATLPQWLSLRGTPADYGTTKQLNLNGIGVYRGNLVTVNSTTGQLFRICLATRSVSVVQSSAKFVDGDGLTIAGDKMWIAQNYRNTVVRAGLSGDAGVASPEVSFTSDDLRIPSSVIRYGGQTVVTRGQFGSPTPVTPFDVAAVAGV